eukprot:5574350-Amphidinium_carterae.1
MADGNHTGSRTATSMRFHKRPVSHQVASGRQEWLPSPDCLAGFRYAHAQKTEKYKLPRLLGCVEPGATRWI